MIDYENEHIYKVIDQIKDESCEVFFENNLCPEWRWHTRECPLHPESRSCIIKKSQSQGRDSFD
jgi:hypothetical protein